MDYWGQQGDKITPVSGKNRETLGSTGLQRVWVPMHIGVKEKRERSQETGWWI